MLTLLAGSAGHTALAVPFGVPIFSSIPLALQRLVNADEDAALLYVRRTVFTLMACCALIAPFVPFYFERTRHHDHIAPRSQAADAAIRLWKETLGVPLRYVGGDRIMSLAVTFRSPDNTSEFNSFNMRWSPEVTPERLRAYGLLVVCTENPGCIELATPYLTVDTRHFDLQIAKNFPGAPVINYSIFIVPPQSN